MKHSLLILFLLIPLQLFAQTSNQEWLQKARIFSNSQYLYIVCDLNISKSEGTKERQLEIYLDQKKNEQKVLIQVIKPGFLRKMKFLSIIENQSTTKWMATSRGVKRLSSSNNSDSLFDSDFTVEDLSPIELSEYNWQIDDSNDSNEYINYILIPKQSNLEYDQKVVSIHKQSLLINSITYLKDNKAVKEYKLISTQKSENEYVTVECQMQSFENNSVSTIKVEEIKTPDSIPTSKFNKGNL